MKGHFFFFFFIFEAKGLFGGVVRRFLAKIAFVWVNLLSVFEIDSENIEFFHNVDEFADSVFEIDGFVDEFDVSVFSIDLKNIEFGVIVFEFGCFVDEFGVLLR